MFSIPLPDVPLPAGGGAKIARIPHRPVRAAFSDSLRSIPAASAVLAAPGPHSATFFDSPRSVPAASAVLAAPGPFWQSPRPFCQPPHRIWQPFPTAPGPHLGSRRCFGSPGPHLAARLDRFVSRRTAFGSRWQALAGSARRNNPQDNTSKSAPSRCAAPIGAQRQSARRPCPWRPAGRRGSCRRPWRRRAGRHRRPASNGPLRGPRHRH